MPLENEDNMAKNKFSEYKSSETNIEIGWWRKTGHSASNWFSARGTEDAWDNVKTGASAANNAVGVMGTAAAAGAWAGSTVGFVTAMSGPQAGVVLGVVAIGLLVKEAYSNREAAHKKLAPYVWTFVDDEPPKPFGTEKELQDICSAAATLLEDGKNQFKIMHSKYSEKQQKFKQFITDYEASLGKINRAADELKLLRGKAAEAAARQRLNNVVKSHNELWEKASAVEGTMFEYVRRCCHVGHYLQASAILNLGVQETLFPGSVVGKQPKDYFPDFFKGTKFEPAREMFKKMSDELDRTALLVRKARQ